MMGVAQGLPEVGLDPLGDESRAGELLWPVVRPMVEQLVHTGADYLIEGAQLQPKHARELSTELDENVRACFLGFAETSTMEKLRQLRCFRLDDYERWDDERVVKEIERLKAFSSRLRTECSRCTVRYIEVPSDLSSTEDMVVRYLRG